MSLEIYIIYVKTLLVVHLALGVINVGKLLHTLIALNITLMSMLVMKILIVLMTMLIANVQLHQYLLETVRYLMDMF